MPGMPPMPFCAHAAMPPISGAPPPALSSFGASAIIASVVKTNPATDAAFCNADLVTLVGSTTPISTRSP